MGDTQARCLHCRKRFAPGHRPNLKYCKPGCRTLAYRARQRAAKRPDDAEARSERAQPKPTHRATPRPLQHSNELQSALPESLERPSEMVAIVTDLKRQNEQSSFTLEQLFALVNSSRQREQELEQELGQAQEALHARVSESERMQLELTNLREQLVKREQAESSEAEIRQRLQNVERFIEVLTLEQQQRREAAQARTDEQVRVAEARQSERTASSAQLDELAATVSQLRDERAELNRSLEASQSELAAAQRRMAKQEAELEQVRREHARDIEAAQEVSAESTAQHAVLESEIARLQQEQVTTCRQLTEASARLDELAASKAAEMRAQKEQLEKLTTERDATAAQYRELLAVVRDLVPLPFAAADPIWARVAPLQNKLKNSLICFLEPLFVRKAPQEKLDDNLMRLALLLAQGRISAMMALGAEAFTTETSEAIVQHALTIIERYRDFYPEEVRAMAKQKEVPLRIFERAISAEVTQQFLRAIAAAPAS